MRSYVTVHDAGRILNPLLAEGQIRGGLAHGLGAALLEEHRYDEDGNLMTATFLDYLPPTATELPRVRSATSSRRRRSRRSARRASARATR